MPRHTLQRARAMGTRWARALHRALPPKRARSQPPRRPPAACVTDSWSKDLTLDRPCPLRLRQEHVVGRNFFVPLDERGYGSESCDRLPVDFPDSVGHRPDVAVEKVRPAVRVPREMQLADKLRRDGID